MLLNVKASTKHKVLPSNYCHKTLGDEITQDKDCSGKFKQKTFIQTLFYVYYFPALCSYIFVKKYIKLEVFNSNF